jgi:hypothetical protein
MALTESVLGYGYRSFSFNVHLLKSQTIKSLTGKNSITEVFAVYLAVLQLPGNHHLRV